MINIAQVLGRVGKMDSAVTSAGMKITKMSIVTSKKYVKDGQKVEKVNWHNIVLFQKLAEIAEKYVAVGDLVYIQGEIETQKYKTQLGEDRSKTSIIAHDLKLMPKAKEHVAAPVDKSFQSADEEDVPW